MVMNISRENVFMLTCDLNYRNSHYVVASKTTFCNTLKYLKQFEITDAKLCELENEIFFRLKKFLKISAPTNFFLFTVSSTSGT